MQTIYTMRLQEGLPALSKAKGEALAEAIAVCLEKIGQTSPTTIQVMGVFDTTVSVVWDMPTEQIKRTWADLQEATEEGAVGLSILLLLHLTDYTIVERSIKGTGFDYWLGDKNDLLFQKKARLEVSGSITLTKTSELEIRVKEKIEQVKVSDYLQLPAIISVVFFRNPLIKIVSTSV